MVENPSDSDRGVYQVKLKRDMAERVNRPAVPKGTAVLSRTANAEAVRDSRCRVRSDGYRRKSAAL
jgi:hypothetical protein